MLRSHTSVSLVGGFIDCETVTTADAEPLARAQRVGSEGVKRNSDSLIHSSRESSHQTIVTRVFQIANGACFARGQSYRSKKQLTALGRAHIIISALVS